VKQKRYTFTPSPLELRAEGEYRAGIAGVVQGVALTYGVEDAYGTMFARGSVDKSIAERVNNRKLNVFLDHDTDVRKHVGVVASARDVGNALVVEVEILDTAAGREALEYVRAALAADVSTGFSIGFVPRAWRNAGSGPDPVIEFTEVELRELSLTPVPAVPGAVATGTRADDASDSTPDVDLLERAAMATLAAMPEARRVAVLRSMGYAPVPADSTTHAESPSARYVPDAQTEMPAPQTVSYAERVALVRASVAKP
jgi:HK97 family phage prohead protease